MRYLRILKILVFAFFMIVSGCSRKDGKDKASAPAKFTTLKLKPLSIVTHLDFPANIQGQQVVEIRPKIDGYIEQIFVSEGALVKKGQLLFRIGNPQVEQEVRTAEASIKIAEAEVLSAEMNVKKVIPLVEKDIV
ncbi:MAG TPA: biotin/lipoyl-binding protein, partial [Bacteroidales bacterium]|nr:biotin/lipoyl-binding protein [Bacteroidales bacterium]